MFHWIIYILYTFYISYMYFYYWVVRIFFQYLSQCVVCLFISFLLSLKDQVFQTLMRFILSNFFLINHDFFVLYKKSLPIPRFSLIFYRCFIILAFTFKSITPRVTDSKCNRQCLSSIWVWVQFHIWFDVRVEVYFIPYSYSLF